MPPTAGRGAGGGAGRGTDKTDKPSRVGFRGTAENAKTRICQRWEAGNCRFGDRCNFAHGDEELRALPPRNLGGGGGRGRGRGEAGSGGRGQGGYGRGSGGAGSGAGSSGGVANGRTRDDPTWKAAGCPVPGPQGWTQYRTESGEAYYHNSKTQETTWDEPECWKNAPKTT